jgi:hypothetical protein
LERSGRAARLGAGTSARPSLRPRLFTALSGLLLVFNAIGPLGQVSSTAAASDQTGDSIPLNTGSAVDPIPYAQTDSGGGDGGSSIGADPSVGRRPSFTPPARPTSRTALKDGWTEDRRLYANPDGTYTLEAGTGINLKDSHGDWTAIDLSLVDDGAGHYHPAAASSGLGLTSSSGDSGFATLTGADGVMSLRTLGYGAGGRTGNKLQFAGSNGSPDVFVQPTDMGFEFGASFAAANVGPGVNFVLDPGALGVSLGSDGTVLLTFGVDGNGQPLVVGSITAPTLLDGAQIPAPLSAVSVSLTQRGDGTYLLGYTVSASWLHAAGRLFPVTLDPTACIRESGGTACNVNSSGTNTDDIWYGSGQPSSIVTSSTTGFIHVGNYQASADPWATVRGVLYFQGVTLADGAVITDATLGLVQSTNYSPTTTQNILARMVNKTTGWDVDAPSATWNNLNGAVNTTYDSPVAHPCTGANCAVSLNVTKMVRAWYTRTPADWLPNIGIQVRYDATAETNNVKEVAFHRGDPVKTPTATQRPLLTITYELGGFGIDFDPALGTTYAPSKMVAGGPPVILPVSVANKGSVTLDTTNYRIGWRFFDVKGKNTAYKGVQALPGPVSPGLTSSLVGLSITPPTVVGEYTLRLDVVKIVSSVNVYYSDWAQPTLFYSRNKNVLSSDSTRWVGSSKMERDEFGINVTNGQGAGGDVQSVVFGSNGQLGINVATRNLSAAADSGMSVADRIPLNLTYGFNSKDTVGTTCSTTYQGILRACGWFTNYDERVTAGTSDGAYAYTDQGGNDYQTDSDYDGQLVGAPVQLSRQQVTLFDENRPTSGGTLVTAASAGIPTISGSNVIRTSANTTTVLGGFIDGAATREISLNAFRQATFWMRTSAATIKVELCFELEDKTNGVTKFFCVEPNSDWDSTHNRTWWGQTVLNNWASFTVDLWGLASGTVGGFSTIGKATDDYFIKSVEVIGDAANTGYVYLDSVKLLAQAPWGFYSDIPPTWTSGSTIEDYGESPNYQGAELATSAVTCYATCFSSRITMEGINGGSYPAMSSLSSAAFLSWWWSKAGGKAVAVTVCVTDSATSVPGELTYYAGAAPPTTVNDCTGLGVADRHFVRVDSTLPTHITRVIRNVLEDSRQILNFYKDADPGDSSAAPPTDGPTPDDVKMTGIAFNPIDGDHMVFADVSLNSISTPYRNSSCDRYCASDNQDMLNYSGSFNANSHGTSDDFIAEYPDGSTHYFNRDGLLQRVRSKDGSQLDLDWSYGAGSGQGNYTLTAIHAPTDNTVDSTLGLTYKHGISLSRATVGVFTQTTFSENLGTTTASVSGRRADFYVAQSSGTTFGVGDLVKVSPARHNSATCGTHPSGCIEYEYTSTTSHSPIRIADPRWDGSTSGASDSRFEIGWTGTDPTSISDRSHGSAPQLRILSWDRGRTASPNYIRALFQDADAVAANYALHEDLSAEGAAFTSYIRQACGSTDCLSSTNWPAGDNTTLGARVAETHSFDGLANTTKATTYRCPGVAVFGCAGTTPIVSTTRQGTNASAKVDNYIDVLTANEIAWTQSADQSFASLRDSGGTNPDLYRTEYAYNGVAEPTVVTQPVMDRPTDYRGTMNATEGLTEYWRMNEASGNLASSVSGGHAATATSLSYGSAGPLARDAANKAVSFNGSTSIAASSATVMSTTGYTIEAWVNIPNASSSDMNIAGRWTSNSGARLFVDSSATFALGHNGTTITAASTGWYPDAGRWYDVVGTWDGNRLALYVDGALVAEGSISNTTGSGGTGFDIGSYDSSGHFNGLIDEVALRSVAIDQSVVRAHYAAGRGVAVARTETVYEDRGSWTHQAAFPVQNASQFVLNGDFSAGLNGWNANHGAVINDENVSGMTPWSGGESPDELVITGTASTDQLAQLVPGQRVHFQLTGGAHAAGAFATYRVDYWQVSTASWQPLIAEQSISATTATTVAYEHTIPAADTTGLLKVTLRNIAGTGSATFGQVLLVTAWQSWTYTDAINRTSVADVYHKAYIDDAMVATTSSITSQGAIRTDTQSYAPEASHQAIFPTKVIANFGDGTPGPAADQDVTTSAAYDAWGRSVGTTDPDGVTTTTIYDPSNLTDVAQVVDDVGQHTDMTYDAVGNLLTAKSPLGLVTSATYDVLNRKLTTTGPDGTTSRTDYDNYGRVAATWANYINGVVELADGDLTDDVLTAYLYDAYGHATQQDRDCGSLAACATGGLDARTTSNFDLLGNVVASTTYPSSGGGGTARTSTSQFETFPVTAGPESGRTFGRLAASCSRLAIAPAASPAPFCPGSAAYSNDAATWLWNGLQLSGVDMNGRTFGTTNAYGIVTLTDGDLAGRPVAVTSNYRVAGGHGSNNDQNVVTATEYDLAGDVIATTEGLRRSRASPRRQPLGQCRDR